MKLFKNTKIIITTLTLMIYSNTLLGSEGHNHKKMNHKNEKPMSEKIKLTKKNKNEILKALEMNEELHLAFFKYDGKKVESIAKKLTNKIDKISHMEIKKLLAFSKGRIASIMAKENKDKNNESYHMFSMAMIHVMNTYDLGDKYKGYRCPMVRKQWVQNAAKMSKVHNPYASNMPHCGEQLK